MLSPVADVSPVADAVYPSCRLHVHHVCDPLHAINNPPELRHQSGRFRG